MGAPAGWGRHCPARGPAALTLGALRHPAPPSHSARAARPVSVQSSPPSAACSQRKASERGERAAARRHNTPLQIGATHARTPGGGVAGRGGHGGKRRHPSTAIQCHATLRADTRVHRSVRARGSALPTTPPRAAPSASTASSLRGQCARGARRLGGRPPAPAPRTAVVRGGLSSAWQALRPTRPARRGAPGGWRRRPGPGPGPGPPPGFREAIAPKRK